MSVWTDKNKLFLSIPVSQLLAITAYGEAGGEGAEGMMAVLNVIRNRANVGTSEFVDSEIYKMTGSIYHAVILKPWQFSMYNTDYPGIGMKQDPVRVKAERLAKNFSSEVTTNPTLAKAHQLAQMLLSGTLADNTGGATHYYNPAGILTIPKWSTVYEFVGKIGSHLFYSIFGGKPPSATPPPTPTPTTTTTTLPRPEYPEPEYISPEHITPPKESPEGESGVQSIVEEVEETATKVVEEIKKPTNALILIGLGIGVIVAMIHKRGGL